MRLASASVFLALAGIFTLLIVGGRVLPAHPGHGNPTAPAAQGVSPVPTMSGQLALRNGGAILSAGVRLAASSGRPIRIQSHAGADLTMEPGASVSVIESGQTHRLALLDGALGVHLAKLPAGERFIVQTSDAEIEVGATQFRVVVGADRTSACGESLVTRVTVSEGAVAVRSGGREIRLVSGDEWRTTCPVAKQALVARAARTSPQGGDARALSALSPVSSSLEAQNELFSAAMRAKRGGRTGDALDLLGQFLYEYPDSPLIESATVQRMRLAAVDDPTWATSIAIRYLTRFPDGYARIEAQEIVASSAQP